MSFHLRPVSDISPSPSPSASASPPHDRSPPFPKHQPQRQPSPPSANTPTSASNPRPRRPLSPTSLRGELILSHPNMITNYSFALSLDVDLTHTPDMPPRKYPAPPTGHDLMAMFPPAPPDVFPDRPGPTSGYFQRQERAFFAQAGKEIVRVRVEVELPQNGTDSDNMMGKSRARSSSGPRSWIPPSQLQATAVQQQRHQEQQQLAHQSPVQSVPPSLHYPHPGARPSPRGAGAVPFTPTPLFPGSAHSPSAQLPPKLHPPSLHQPGLGLRTPPQDPMQSGPPVPKSEYQADGHNDPDESWRTPMPYAERRRAGKHTRRVIVRT